MDKLFDVPRSKAKALTTYCCVISLMHLMFISFILISLRNPILVPATPYIDVIDNPIHEFDHLHIFHKTLNIENETSCKEKQTHYTYFH